MLRQSFVLLRGIGRRTENRLRSLGVVDWKTFLASGEVPGIGKARKAALDAHLKALGKCLERGDAVTLGNALPASEKWRLYPDFRDRAAFLDIETTGIDAQHDQILTIQFQPLDRATRGYLHCRVTGVQRCYA